MRRSLIVFILFILSITYSITLTGKVTRVKDGDTIVFVSGLQSYTVRLEGIDTPESSQSYGKEATVFTRSFCKDTTIIIKITTTDRYGRSIATVYNSSGKCLQRELLRAGLAWHYTRYSSDGYYSALSRIAVKEHKGLWQEDNPIAPWDYRRHNK